MPSLLCVPVVLAVEPPHQVTVHIKELIVLELSMPQAGLHQQVSFTGGALLQMMRSMQFLLLESLQTPGNMQNVHLPFLTWVLDLQIGNRLIMFSNVNPAGSDSISHDRKCLFLYLGTSSYYSCPPNFFLQVVLG